MWTFDQPAASRVTVGDGWVAVASYADGRRRDSVLSLDTGEEKWSRVSTDSVASGPEHASAPLVIDGGFVHLERNGISDGATIESVDADSGNVRWAEEQPRWFEAPPWKCGEQRICAVTWDTYDGARRIIELDSADGHIVAQGRIYGTEIYGDVRLVTGDEPDERPPYPQPPATIPGDEPTSVAPPETTAPAGTTPETAPAEGAESTADGFRSPQSVATPEVDQAATVTRFSPTGERLWQFPLSDLLPSADASYATPVGVLDEATNTFVIATPAGAIQPGNDVVIGMDYNTGERLWTAENRSFDCWEWMVRPANVRCHVQGSLQTTVVDGVVSLLSNSEVTVTFEAFDPRSGDTLGQVTAAYPAWDGQGERPIVPAVTWLVDGGLVVESTQGLVGLSSADGEVVPVTSDVVGWCQNPPVDDDGEVYPGYFPCAVGDPTRTPTADVVPPIPSEVGSETNGVAVYVASGQVNAFRLAG